MLSQNSNYEVQVIRSNRKTESIQIINSHLVRVRVPLRTTDREVKELLDSKQSWIIKNLNEVAEREKNISENALPVLTQDQIREMADQALKLIPPRVRMYARMIGVSYGQITIRNQKTRWGSCSSKRNLNFNCLLTRVPPQVMDYVIVHELCHLRYMNHSKEFWSEVERYLPEYKEHRSWLKANGSALIRQMYPD